MHSNQMHILYFIYAVLTTYLVLHYIESVLTVTLILVTLHLQLHSTLRSARTQQV